MERYVKVERLEDDFGDVKGFKIELVYGKLVFKKVVDIDELERLFRSLGILGEGEMVIGECVEGKYVF